MGCAARISAQSQYRRRVYGQRRSAAGRRFRSSAADMYRWAATNLLSDNEIDNLSIARGTLTPEERQIINRHMNITVDMLESLPFPKHLQRVPEFACGHHEKMDGTGYPKGLKKEQMSIPARMMAIADIFEALSASDRPYKDGKPLSECLNIMGRMKQNQHIDPDSFDIFIDQKCICSTQSNF